MGLDKKGRSGFAPARDKKEKEWIGELAYVSVEDSGFDGITGDQADGLVSVVGVFPAGVGGDFLESQGSFGEVFFGISDDQAGIVVGCDDGCQSAARQAAQFTDQTIRLLVDLVGVEFQGVYNGWYTVRAIGFFAVSDGIFGERAFAEFCRVMDGNGSVMTLPGIDGCAFDVAHRG